MVSRGATVLQEDTTPSRSVGASTPEGRGPALTPREAAAYVGLSASTLAKKRVKGDDSPLYVQSIPNGSVRYRRADLDDWMAARLQRSTSDRTPIRGNRPRS